LLTIKQLVYILFFLVATKLLAQEPVYYQLTEKDGLPDIEFYDIIEDKEGFIWLAANKGLFRYDGKEFKSYTHPKKKGLSLFNLSFDHKNRLWCNNISGQFFYIENDSLHHFIDINSKKRGQLLNYFIDENKLYVSGFDVAETISIHSKKHETIKENIPGEKFFLKINDSVFYQSHHDIYSKENDFKSPVYTINTTTSKGYGKLEVKAKNLGKNNASLLQIIDHHAKKNIYFLKNRGRIKQLTKNELDLNTIIINSYTEDDYLWLATESGLYYYQYKDGKFILLNHFFKDEYFSKIIKDQQNNYWLTSLKNGIYILPNINLKHFQDTDRKNITTLEKLNHKELIIGTNKGELIKKNITNSQQEFLTSLSNKEVKVIASNKENLLFVSHQDKGYVINYKTINKLNDWKLNFTTAKEMSFINEDEVVYGAFNCARVINLKNKTYQTIGHRRSYTTHYNSIDNTIYVGYVDGLEYYKKDLKPNVIKFKGKPIFPLDITNTKNNTVWISTFSDGIIGVKDGKVIYNFTQDSGLLSNQTKLVKGDGNNLWIVSDKGLQYYNTISKEFKSITPKDGLASFTISEIAVFKNELILGTNKGLFTLQKEKAFKDANLSDFYFTRISVEDKEVSIKNDYRLSSSVNKIEFEFHTNGFLAQEDISYQYRLLGSSKEWSTVPKNANQVIFSSLSAGKYTFQIKKTSLTSKHETPIKSISIYIKQAFYLQWWFVTLFITLITCIVLLVVKNREKRIKQKQTELLEKERLQKQMVSSKLKSLQSQLNPHFVFNSMNSIQNLILTNDKEGAYTYLSKFASLMRDNLQMSEESFVYFEDEINHLKKYLELEKLRFIETFQYNIIINKKVSNHKIPSTIIQPFVENAIKHGLLHKKTGDKKIEIIFSQSKNILVCEIIDNGIGIEKSKKINSKNNTKSFSTKAIKEKLDLLKKYYHTDIGFHYEEVSVGTKLILKIPFINLDKN